MMQVVEGEVKGRKKKGVQVGGCTLFMPDDVDVESQLYSSYAEALLDGTVSNNSFVGNFVQKAMNRIAISANKDADIALKAMKEFNKIAYKTQDYFNRKKSTDIDFARYLLRDRLSNWQQTFFDDTNKKIAMLAGRRAGKSFSVVSKALKHCLLPPQIINNTTKKRTAAIIGLTLEKTASLYWDLIKTTLDATHIHTSHIDNGSYEITFSNGNTLFLYGNNSKAEREKLRGFDISFVAIDECQSQQALLYLVETVLGPQLKAQNGELVLLGTAPLNAGTYWEKCIQDEAFSHIHATMEDNPFIPNYEHALEEILEENHWSKDNITFRREYLGEIAYDTNRLIYSTRTYYDTIPDTFKPTCCYIGLDFGWQDYSSFAPIIFDNSGEGYLIDEWKQNKTPSSQIVEKAKTLVEKIHKQYNIPIEDIHLVADTSHQQVSADIYNRGVFQMQNAYKLDENYQINRVAEALEVGYLHIKKDDYFDQECNQFVWQWNDEHNCVIYKIDEDVFHPDIADSVKYALNTYLSDHQL